ncbi:hypothetical protein A2300_02115 [Candidatus Falkowbacteria bacterium RIFOXYB2_FULL_35_7]|uniref:RNase H type-1 domain-containing protein n=1 Tax=Candidatus Falkowbacteria bacterium RIFOXYC2_FULL_36_12 TaxID=1798002 RepID=A0A1F5SYD6_9BACT|nr:MAG: hypothetical protein A2300_02115 [Candidatus Falkowbacteria bacterium RIFOXYB2_FULL_35_7]OGF31737.1 MAG: hypothetical protein A2478_04600 [Candidatus Falkowbacteria bacterium RIFOXYC2_FULL_36_12]
MKLKIYSDGGARGNPGPAGIGVAIYDEKNKLIDQVSKYIGETTNNQAEYQAIICGLETCNKLGATEVTCFLDSELVVRQINGDYKVKDPGLAKQFMKVWNLRHKFSKSEFKHIVREKNKVADKLANDAMDKAC